MTDPRPPTHRVWYPHLTWESAMTEAQECAALEGCFMVVYEQRREKEGRFFHVRSITEPMPEEWSIATRVDPDA